MAIAKITKGTINKIVPSERPVILFDTELRGFGVRVLPSGSMAYVLEYRPGSGGRHVAKRRITVGKVGVLTPDQARAKAKLMLADIAHGQDPAVDRRRARETPTFKAFATDMLDAADKIAQAKPTQAVLRPASIQNYRSILRKHVGPAIGSRTLDAIGKAEVARLHAKVGATSPAVANRICEFVGRTYKAAAEAGVIAEGTNPARGIKQFKELRRERFLSGTELQRLGAAISEAETIGVLWEPDPMKKTKHVPKNNQRTIIDPDAAAALRLLIFTGARLREILHLRWRDVDLERGVIFVHGKTGRRPVIVPAPAAVILAELPRRDQYVFPGANSTPQKPLPRADLKRPWRAVSKRAGLEGVRLHDLRHSFASFAAAGGASLPIIGKLLGHTQPSTTARYSHLADDPLRAVADKVGATVAAALSGRASADVVLLHSAEQRVGSKR